MRVGKAGNYIADYSLRVGETRDPVRPYRGAFRVEGVESTAYLNGGRFFYRGFEAMLDAECGWFGLREIGGGDGGDDDDDNVGGDDVDAGGSEDDVPP